MRHFAFVLIAAFFLAGCGDHWHQFGSRHPHGGPPGQTRKSDSHYSGGGTYSVETSGSESVPPGQMKECKAASDEGCEHRRGANMEKGGKDDSHGQMKKVAKDKKPKKDKKEK